MDLVVLVAFSSWLAPALGEHHYLFETDLCAFTCFPPPFFLQLWLCFKFRHVKTSCLYNRISVWQGSVW